ncbi:hypothetical protein C8Q70DRAFT_539825 [Cubamyces menziesii]|nr:hypothetical protein C8Q70DRAFT_539825 [Cubamyces menziesii]
MNTPADSWGGPSSSVDRPRALKPPPANVRDDWDDDEDDAEEQEDPNQVWKEANKRAPMPQVVIAGSSTSGTAALSPPPAALQPVLRILKRPQASATRIFGEGGVGATSSESGKDIANLARGGPNPGNIPVQIAREPKGPPSTDATATGNKYQANDPRGFSSRRGKRGGRGKA